MKEKLIGWMKTRRGNAHVLRLVVGGYLVYLGISIIKHMGESAGNTFWLYVFSVFFLVVGTAAAVLSLYAVYYGYNLEQSRSSSGEDEENAAPDGQDDDLSGK